MHVHFVAVAGTGMGSLAGLYKSAGHRVTGSDIAFYPPMGPALKAWGIELFEGYDPAHLEPAPDLVVVGNVCRPDHPEARAAIDRGLRVVHIGQALDELVLSRCSPLVVAGTHGKTTTSSLCAHLLQATGRTPGFLIGGVPKNFDRSYQLPPSGTGKGLPIAEQKPALRRTPFVVEGDEYDTAFFEKTPKFWHYKPEVAVLTSVEQDHVDIYPDPADYEATFVGFLERIGTDGLIVAYAGDPDVVRLVEAHGKADVAWYAVDGEETHGMPPHWMASPAGVDARGQSFDLFAGGVAAGRAAVPLSGRHNLRNVLGALGAVCQGYGVSVKDAMAALTSFEGVARRQDLRGVVDGVRVYDDFAHHPTALRETLRGLRRRHPEGALWAVYEPRTATACRQLHQKGYLQAFDAADEVVLAPLGRDNIPEEERLDLPGLVDGLRARGVSAEAAPDLDAIIARVTAQACPGDTVVLLSNGAFGGIHERLMEALAARD